MKRMILVSMLSAAAMFAQSTPAQSTPAAPQSGSASKSTNGTVKKHKKAKKTTAPASAAKPAVTSAPAKQ